MVRYRRSEMEFSLLPSSYEKVIRLWVLNILLGLSAHRNFIDERGFSDDEIVEFLDLTDLGLIRPFDAQAARTALREKHSKALARPAGVPTNSCIAKNITWLRDMAGLSEVESEILHFTVVSGQHPLLAKVLEMAGPLSLGMVEKMFSIVLDQPLKAVSQALRSSSALSRTGLLKVDLMSRYTFSNKVELLRGLADQLAVEHKNPFELFAGCFVEAPASMLGPENYPHLKADLDILSCYLRQALAERRLGINVLIYGAPGTGKTEFARLLASNLGHSLFEVATEDADGGPLKGETRFRSYRLSQAILSRGGQHLICFDEVEDVFRQKQEEQGFERGNTGGQKGWINRTLESNPCPALWITNSIASIDPAFLRRFDYVLQMGIPPRSSRAKVLNDYLVDLPLEVSTKASMSQNENLAPAVVERAAKVLRAIHEEKSSINLDKALERIIWNTLEATGVSREAKVSAQNQTTYRPELLNADCDLIKLKAGLMEHGKGRLCLYGPPGTGKTAYGHHLAEALDRPLLVKRASDLQSKWVGGTEKNLAAMFQEAKHENALLLLDEADSFLRRREDAERSWEVSTVSEMLVQLESFDGVFIASTNLMDTLDAASLRRFDLKIEFRFLKPEGAWSLFQDTAVSLGFDVEESDHLKLGRVRNLTPGDFANVMRQSRLRPIQSASQIIDLLKAEVALKPESRTKSLGF